MTSSLRPFVSEIMLMALDELAAATAVKSDVAPYAEIDDAIVQHSSAVFRSRSVPRPTKRPCHRSGSNNFLDQAVCADWPTIKTGLSRSASCPDSSFVRNGDGDGGWLMQWTRREPSAESEWSKSSSGTVSAESSVRGGMSSNGSSGSLSLFAAPEFERRVSSDPSSFSNLSFTEWTVEDTTYTVKVQLTGCAVCFRISGELSLSDLYHKAFRTVKKGAVGAASSELDFDDDYGSQFVPEESSCPRRRSHFTSSQLPSPRPGRMLLLAGPPSTAEQCAAGSPSERTSVHHDLEAGRRRTGSAELSVRRADSAVVEFCKAEARVGSRLHLKYLDEDGDWVVLLSERDWIECLAIAARSCPRIVHLKIGGHSEAGDPPCPAPPASTSGTTPRCSETPAGPDPSLPRRSSSLSALCGPPPADNPAGASLGALSPCSSQSASNLSSAPAGSVRASQSGARSTADPGGLGSGGDVSADSSAPKTPIAPVPSPLGTSPPDSGVGGVAPQSPWRQSPRRSSASIPQSQPLAPLAHASPAQSPCAAGSATRNVSHSARDLACADMDGSLGGCGGVARSASGSVSSMPRTDSFLLRSAAAILAAGFHNLV